MSSENGGLAPTVFSVHLETLCTVVQSQFEIFALLAASVNFAVNLCQLLLSGRLSMA